jgi:hypothetical protein
LLAQGRPETLAAAVDALLARERGLINQFFRWRPFDGWSRLQIDGSWAVIP